MKIERQEKSAFVVIGKEGSTRDGPGFVQKLWQEANSHFDEIRSLAKRDQHGNLAGIWGAMSDFSRAFKPWEGNFSQGLYLAGVECVPGAEAPGGWTKWTIPGYEYLCVEAESEASFSQALDYIRENGLTLVGAVQDFSCPATGKDFLFFPIRLL